MALGARTDCGSRLLVEHRPLRTGNPKQSSRLQLRMAFMLRSFCLRYHTCFLSHVESLENRSDAKHSNPLCRLPTSGKGPADCAAEVWNCDAVGADPGSAAGICAMCVHMHARLDMRVRLGASEWMGSGSEVCLQFRTFCELHSTTRHAYSMKPTAEFLKYCSPNN